MSPRVLAAALLTALGPAAATGLAQEGGQTPPEAAAPAAEAAAAPEPAPDAFDSPRSTMRTFLEAMDGTGDRGRAVECLDLSLVGEETARDIAVKLLGILNRIERVEFWRLPDDRDVGEGGRFADLNEYVFFPRYPDHAWVFARADVGDHEIVLSRRAGGWWKFSAETVKGIPDLYDRVRGLDVLAGLTQETELSLSLRLQSWMPTVLVENSMLGLKYWHWLGLFALILAGVVLDFTFRVVLAIVSRRVIARRGGEARSETVRRTVRPFGLALAAVFWLAAIRLLDLPAEVLTVLLAAVRFFAMLAGVWAGFRLTDLVSEVLIGKAAATESKFDDLLVPLVRKAVKIFIFVFGLIYIADSLNIEIAPLLAGLGIGGLGFAFAARDTLENFFGSVTVIADRPFQVGDWVAIGDVEGTVEDVGFRSSRIRTFYNSLVTIPNGNLVRAIVDNFGRRKYRRWKTHVAITYDTPPERIEAFCEGIRELIRLHPYTRKDYYQVWLHQFGPSSLDVLVYMFHEAPDWSTELRERHRLMVDIIRLAGRLGVSFAFPTETVHLVQEPAADELPASAPAAGADAGARREGRRVVGELTAAADWRVGRPGPYVFDAPSPPETEGDDQIESRVGGDAG